MRGILVCAFLLPSVLRLKLNWFNITARVVAGVLAGGLLVLELLAADGAFHKALHQDGKTNCVICLFVKGQAHSAQTAPVLPGCVWRLSDASPRVEPIVLASFTYLASFSRAPPALGILLSVVA